MFRKFFLHFNNFKFYFIRLRIFQYITLLHFLFLYYCFEAFCLWDPNQTLNRHEFSCFLQMSYQFQYLHARSQIQIPWGQLGPQSSIVAGIWEHAESLLCLPLCRHLTAGFCVCISALNTGSCLQAAGNSCCMLHFPGMSFTCICNYTIASLVKLALTNAKLNILNRRV